MTPTVPELDRKYRQRKKDMIEFSVSNHGAELQSLQKDGKEYLWHGDATYWGRRSPILFPMVGKVYGGVFHVEGKEYPMGQHGFARDSEFVKDGERYVLDGCPLEKYPYFEFVYDEQDLLIPLKING